LCPWGFRIITEKKADEAGVSWPYMIAFWFMLHCVVCGKRVTPFHPFNRSYGDPMKLPLMSAAFLAAALFAAPVLADAPPAAATPAPAAPAAPAATPDTSTPAPDAGTMAPKTKKKHSSHKKAKKAAAAAPADSTAAPK
jgi:hypothetical protein